MYTNILVPYDKSEHAHSALATAIEMASKEEKASVTVLYVTGFMNFDDPNIDVVARMAGIPTVTKEDVAAARENFLKACEQEVREDIESLDLDIPDNVAFDIKLESGQAAGAICTYATKWDIDCIVMGRRGLGAVRAAIGSVSFAVLRDLDLPVFIVK